MPRPRRGYVAGSEYSPKRVRVLPGRAAEQVARGSQGNHCLGLCSSLPAFRSPPSKAWGSGRHGAPPPPRRAGSQRSEQAGPPRLRLAPRRSQSTAGEARPLPGRKAGRSAELAGPSVPHRLRAGPEWPQPAQAWRPVPVCVWGSRG